MNLHNKILTASYLVEFNGHRFTTSMSPTANYQCDPSKKFCKIPYHVLRAPSDSACAKYVIGESQEIDGQGCRFQDWNSPTAYRVRCGQGDSDFVISAASEFSLDVFCKSSHMGTIKIKAGQRLFLKSSCQLKHGEITVLESDPLGSNFILPVIPDDDANESNDDLTMYGISSGSAGVVAILLSFFIYIAYRKATNQSICPCGSNCTQQYKNVSQNENTTPINVQGSTALFDKEIMELAGNLIVNIRNSMKKADSNRPTRSMPDLGPTAPRNVI